MRNKDPPCPQFPLFLSGLQSMHVVECRFSGSRSGGHRSAVHGSKNTGGHRFHEVNLKMKMGTTERTEFPEFFSVPSAVLRRRQE